VVPSFQNTTTPVLIGLVFMLGGLFTATKWR
jgi:LPXTG-motif cell wall-anchored protein